jgi:hypothetical protein
MATLPYAVIDADRCFVAVLQASSFPDDPERFNVPFNAVLTLPALPIPDGSAEQWTADPGVQEGDYWQQFQDNRRVELWLADGTQYQRGTETEFGTYNGLGPIPDWLLTEQPEIEPPDPGPAPPSDNTILQGENYIGVIQTGDLQDTLPPQNNLLAAFSDPAPAKGRIVQITFMHTFVFPAASFTASGSNWISAPVTYVYSDDYGGLKDAEFSVSTPMLNGRTDFVALAPDTVDDVQASLALKVDVQPVEDITLACTVRLVGSARDDPWLLEGGVWNDAGAWNDTATWQDGESA